MEECGGDSQEKGDDACEKMKQKLFIYFSLK